MPPLSSLLFLACTQFTLATLDDMPYCALRFRRLCQNKGTHIACTFPDPGPSAACINYTAINFNNQMKNFILFYINRRRQRIASGNEKVRGGQHLPRPEVMMLVEWDRELAFLAQRLADQCQFVHDDCRATVRYPFAGQTVGEVRWRRSGEPIEHGARRAIRRVLDAWWGERRRASPQQLTAPFHVAARGAVWGHFSQLCIWGLQAMGCGAVHHGASHPRLLLVCDFSHTNMLGQRTINPGPLAPCPVHTMRKPRTQFPLLCAPLRQSTSPSEAEDEPYDDDVNIDPGLTVDFEETPTMGYQYSRYRETRVRDTMRAPTHSTSSIMVYKEVERPGAKSVVEKLDRELEGLNKADSKAVGRWRGDQAAQEWHDRRPYFGKLREHQESFEDVIPVSATSTRREVLNEKPYYRFTSTLFSPVSNIRVFELILTVSSTVGVLLLMLLIKWKDNLPLQFQETYQRQRWKQTRVRPLRPGANALLMTTVPVKYLNRHSVGSMMLDKEDVDQLYKDTGFKMSMRT